MSHVSQDLSVQFRQAMRRLAATVTIVTTRCSGSPVGMTASAVTSLSMDPPSLLICVNRSASFHKAIASSELFCVNILTSAQADISAAFGGSLSAEERFVVGDWRFDREAPILRGAQANILCKRANLFDHGTHSICVGEATELIINDPVAPLIYLNGQYMAAADRQPV